jgi:hypothetical protein
MRALLTWRLINPGEGRPHFGNSKPDSSHLLRLTPARVQRKPCNVQGYQSARQSRTNFHAVTLNFSAQKFTKKP